MLVQKTSVEMFTVKFHTPTDLTEDQYTELVEKLDTLVDNRIMCGAWWDGLIEEGNGVLRLNTPVSAEEAEMLMEGAEYALKEVLGNNAQ
jgi:hypothetical protein